MKFELDTENKTIKLKEDVKLSDLVQELKDLLDIDWENYTLVVDKKKDHIIIPPTYTPPNNPNTPNQDPNDPYRIYC